MQAATRGELQLQEVMSELSLSPRRLMTLASLDKVSCPVQLLARQLSSLPGCWAAHSWLSRSQQLQLPAPV